VRHCYPELATCPLVSDRVLIICSDGSGNDPLTNSMLLDRPVAAELVRKFLASVTQRIIAAYTRGRHRSISWARWIQSTPRRIISFKIHFTVFPVIYVSLPKCLRIMSRQLMMFTSMGWDYVSELRLPTDLLFIPQVIYEHGEPWRNDIDSRILLFSPPELSGKHTSSHLVAKLDELAKEMINFALRSIFSYLEKFFNVR
jgi:hypothetical protein